MPYREEAAQNDVLNNIQTSKFGCAAPIKTKQKYTDVTNVTTHFATLCLLATKFNRLSKQKQFKMY